MQRFLAVVLAVSSTTVLAQVDADGPVFDAPFSAPRNLRSTDCKQGCFNPIEAVTYASTIGQRGGVAGEFDLTVRAVGQADGAIYINSEKDYRDRNCLTVAIPQATARVIFGTTDPALIGRRLIGQRLVVAGVARQVRIDLTERGIPTGKYYYQIHVRVTDRRQMRTVPPRPA